MLITSDPRHSHQRSSSYIPGKKEKDRINLGRKKIFSKKGSRPRESCLNQDLSNTNSAQDQLLIPKLEPKF